MTNLEDIIASKTVKDAEWKAQQQAERDNVTAMQDFGVESITTDPEQYIRYLTMQGDNYSYSAGNVAIALVGLPDATVFGTRERWQSLNRTILADEEGRGVKIFARTTGSRGYVLADAYDVSQTQGKNLKRLSLRDDTPEMASALETLFKYSKVKLTIDRELTVPAFYDEDGKELAINPDFPDSEAFATIAAEVTLTRFHEKGFNRDYSWARYELDAQSVSFILCRRFGIDPKTPNLERLAERFEGMDSQECKKVLDKIQDMSKRIGHSIEKELSEKQRSRSAVRRSER